MTRASARLIETGDSLCGPPAEENLHPVEAVAQPQARARRPRNERFFAPECPGSVAIVGQSRAMRHTLEMLHRVAKSSLSPILVMGETGTGKELAALAIHALRGGTPQNFVAVNCAALTPTLLESELFGHTKGSFTGADRDKAGLFEIAENGTIFLDEISEMPTSLQAKLLRVLQEREFRRVGGTRNIPCQATVIASSNRDLGAETREHRFRADLYFRLAVFPVVMPPLGDANRRDDIPLLAEYFLETAAGDAGSPRTLTEAARQVLLRHRWPGNVRELRNVIERALVLAPADEITPEALLIDGLALPNPAVQPAGLPANEFSLETAERLFIMRALEQTGWQRTQAARLLGITRATLHAKLKRYKIVLPEAPRTPGADLLSARPASRLREACL